MLYSTVIDGSGYNNGSCDTPSAIAVDENGDACIAGTTRLAPGGGSATASLVNVAAGQGFASGDGQFGRAVGEAVRGGPLGLGRDGDGDGASHIAQDLIDLGTEVEAAI